MNHTRRKLTKEDVFTLLGMVDQGTKFYVICERFNVSERTIARIKAGQSYPEHVREYTRIKKENEEKQIALLPHVPEKIADLIDQIAGVKNHFGFDFSRPLNYGYFDSWDGLHSAVTDNLIVWESDQLATFAKVLQSTKIDTAPIYADKVRELPTFELASIMEQPVCEPLYMTADNSGVVHLKNKITSVVIASKYAGIAARMKLDIRLAGRRRDFVYLTKAKSRVTAQDSSVVMACVATVRT